MRQKAHSAGKGIKRACGNERFLPRRAWFGGLFGGMREIVVGGPVLTPRASLPA